MLVDDNATTLLHINLRKPYQFFYLHLLIILAFLQMIYFSHTRKACDFDRHTFP